MTSPGAEFRLWLVKSAQINSNSKRRLGDPLVILFREFASSINLFFRKLVRRYVKKIIEIALTGTDVIPTVRAAITSHEFEVRHLSNVPFFKTRRDLFKACLDQVKAPDDLHLEFGVYKADSINMCAKLAPQRSFIGFDSFQGLPEAWTLGARKGAFDIGGKLPSVRKNVSLVKGFFDASLPGFCKENQGRTVAFIHIDCDLYTATRDVLNLLRPMFRPGTVIAFDEYYNYPDWLEHEYKAWMEFVEVAAVKFAYIGYIRTGNQVALRIDAIGASTPGQ